MENPSIRRSLTPRLNKYIQHKPWPKQAAFLLLPNREAFYGGAGGGGKSDAGLMGALQYADIPGYNALMLRRTYPELVQPEGLLTRSHEWLDNTDAEWHAGLWSWIFPSGARLRFGHMANEADKRKYQGGAYQYIFFDELTAFLETQYRYLFGWLRKLKGINIPLRMRSGSNPGGIGHEWVKDRFVDPGDPKRPFIPALISDNPALDQKEYEISLAEMTPTMRERILNGNWDAMEEGNAFKREWFLNCYVDLVPENTQKVRTWDTATTAKTSADYTAGGLHCRNGEDMIVEDMIRGQWEYPTVRAMIIDTAKKDGFYIPIGIEGGGPQNGFVQDVQNELEKFGYTVVNTAGPGDKFNKSLPVQNKAKTGHLFLKRAGWNRNYIDELCMFRGDGKTHDDQIDTSSAAFKMLFQPEPEPVALGIFGGI